MGLWTTPKTWAVDELLTAAKLNTHVRDNLLALKVPPQAEIVRDNGARYVTTSGTWVSVDSTNLKLSLTTSGGDVELFFQGVLSADSATGRHAWFDFRIDGAGGYAVDLGYAGGLVRVAVQTTMGAPVQVGARVAGLSAGSHTFEVIWRQSGGIAYLNSDTVDANPEIEQPILFWGVER